MRVRMDDLVLRVREFTVPPGRERMSFLLLPFLYYYTSLTVLLVSPGVGHKVLCVATKQRGAKG